MERVGRCQRRHDSGHEAFAIPNASGRSCAGDSRCEYERVFNVRQAWLNVVGFVFSFRIQVAASDQLNKVARLKDASPDSSKTVKPGLANSFVKGNQSLLS